MTDFHFYQLGHQQYPQLPIPIMQKLLNQEPFILINDIPVTWTPDGPVNWKAEYFFDNENVSVIIEPPIHALKFNSKTEDASGFGLSDAKILLNIEGGIAPYRVELKVNRQLFRTIENIPTSTSEYNCPLLGLPTGDYNFDISDSQTPPVIIHVSDDWNLSSPPYITLNGTVNPLGIETTVSFQYGETIEYGHEIQYGTNLKVNPINALLKLSAGSFNETSILVPGQTYHYRCKAVNAISPPQYGEDMTFTVPGVAPIVRTLPVTY